MKARIIFGSTFVVSMLLLWATAETLWTLPIFTAAMIISLLCGRLWKEMIIMQELKVNGVRVRVINDTLTKEEIRAYLDETYSKAKGRKLLSLDIVVDKLNEEVELTSEWESVPFERIRRVTGYLTGRYGKVNNAKKAEIADRTANNIDRDLAEVLAEIEAR